jgi:hypothetical protein
LAFSASKRVEKREKSQSCRLRALRVEEVERGDEELQAADENEALLREEREDHGEVELAERGESVPEVEPRLTSGSTDRV